MYRYSIKWLIIGLFLVSPLCFFSSNIFGATIQTPTIAKIDVYEADLREVFRSLGELGNLSVLLDPDVRGNATISLKAGLTVQEAIELLAQTYGYSFRWLTASRTVIIGGSKTLANLDVPETRVYHFNYAQTDQLVEVLKNIVPADKIGVDKRTNQLTITASVLQHQNIAEVIKHLDRDMPQVTIEIRVEEVKKSLVESAGVVWSGGSGTTSKDITIDFSQPTITAVMSHYLQLWEQNNQAKLLSNPKIATTDSQEGSIFIGEKYPITNKTTDSNNNTTYTVSYVDIGTRLSVTPRINENDTVTVNVKATVSNISEYETINNDRYPVVRNRDISSVIHLRDGDTFVLSGLSEIQKSESTTGIKGLNKLPLIGWLFKNKTTDPNSDTEVCIFITPKIVKLTKEPDNNPNPPKPVSETKTEKPSNQPKDSQKKVQMTDSLGSSNQTINRSAATSVLVAESDSAPSKSEVINTQPSTTTPPVDQISHETEVQPSADTLESNPPPPNPGVAVDQSNKASTQPDEVKKVRYLVKPGNTLAAIASNFGVKADDILRENGLKPGAKLKSGAKLVIPVPLSHIYHVKWKETLWRIATRYGVSIRVLQEINQISDITKIVDGQEIILPVPVEQVANHSY